MNTDEEEIAKETVDAIEKIVGISPGYRRVHAKGISFNAVFEPSGMASSLTTASHLQKEKTSVIVRFSHTFSSPERYEALVPIKGMAVHFLLPNNQFTVLTMVNVPVFITKTPEAFINLLKVMSKDSLTGRVKFEKLRKSFEWSTIPKVLLSLKPVASFSTETYHALHTYYLIGSNGEKQAVRFKWVPIINESLEKSSLKHGDLEKEIATKLDKMPIRFRLILQLATSEDPIEDPSVEWPDERQTIDAGLLTLKEVIADGAEDLVFDPTVVTEGIECSEDPVLQFRSSVYKESALRRHGERKKLYPDE
ncbi:catalase [Sporosarcina siberiensis]|uniref:Catalase-related peroxidase n=1 Tax=Sporosarcina siberiensis TaxID=1365606 RepID=A0ABW4SGB2_9BACL